MSKTAFPLMFVFLVSMVSISPATLRASGYPPDYAHQTVRVNHDGPALFALVSSGIMSRHVIGYKKPGYLSKATPRAIDVVITATCQAHDGSRAMKTTSVELGPEWNGTGYMSAPLAIGAHLPEACASSHWTLSVAFSDRAGNWDSRNGLDYHYASQDAWSASARVHPTGQPGPAGGYEINERAWAFIVGQMLR